MSSCSKELNLICHSASPDSFTLQIMCLEWLECSPSAWAITPIWETWKNLLEPVFRLTHSSCCGFLRSETVGGRTFSLLFYNYLWNIFLKNETINSSFCCFRNWNKSWERKRETDTPQLSKPARAGLVWYLMPETPSRSSTFVAGAQERGHVFLLSHVY